ncbi:MAG: LysR family transcriptional regulator [Acidiferrobacterales bacterium]|nr:LysR family transcriptional regulator [Acidiferrobacterales bacterium]
MDIQQLLYFVKSVENSNISQTAQELNISQPAVSKGIKKLESELQTKLIERYGKGIRATQTGEVLYKHAKTILNQIKRTREDIETTKSNGPKTIFIGCSPSFIDNTLPTILTAFNKQWPSCSVSVIKGLYPELLTYLKSGELDAVLVLDSHSYSESEIHIESLGTSDIVFLVNPMHSLAINNTKNKPISITQLHQQNWIVLDATDTLNFYQSVFKNNNLIPRQPTVLSGSMNIIKSCLLSNELVGFLPKNMVKQELSDGSLVQLNSDLDSTEMEIILAHKETLFPSPILKTFLDLTKQIIESNDE